MKGKLSTRIWLVAVFVFVGILVLLRDRLVNDAGDILESVKISRDNFFYYFSPERNPPLSTEELEIRLKTTFGEPFVSFSYRDWQDLWQVIYGTYEPDEPPRPRLPRKARQLTVSEMEERLKVVYPEFFGKFNGQYWGEFWGLVLKK